MTYEKAVNDAVAKLIRDLMRRKGLLLKHVIEKTGIPPSTVDRHANGRTIPKLEERERYAKAFGMSMQQFEEAWQAIADGDGPDPFETLIAELSAETRLWTDAKLRDAAATAVKAQDDDRAAALTSILRMRRTPGVQPRMAAKKHRGKRGG